MTNFAREQAAAAADSPARPAVRLDDLTLTYRDLDAAVAQAAGLLRGRGAGDRVGMQLPNVPLLAGRLLRGAAPRDFAKSKVAAYKYPRIVWLAGELPKGPAGKILKRKIDKQDPPAQGATS